MTEAVHEAVRDPERLRAVRETELLDSAPEESFDRLTRLAARVVDAPLALFNLVAEDRQYAKSCFAPESWPTERNLPLADSFCKFAVSTREPLIVRDAREDPRVASSQIVTRLGVLAYLGIPLITSEGYPLGTLCAADFRPREWRREETEALAELAASVVTEIELRRAVRETEKAEHLAGVAERERREKSALLESTTEGIYGVDLRGRCTFLNRAASHMLGYTPEECLGQNMHRLIHHSYPDGTPYPEEECRVFRALREGSAVRVESEVLWRKDGTSFPASYASSPICESGVAQGAVVTFADITERKQEEEAQRFFSEAGKVLAASSLDYTATLKLLVRLSAPALGDWCSLYIFREDGQIERLEIAHADPEKEKVAQALKRYPIDPEGSHPAFTVLKTGEPILLPEIPEAMVAAVAQDEEHLRILRELGMRSGMVVPLTARGRILGSMTIVAAESRRRYTEEDLVVAQEFARRAALAVDNARLYRESQEANRTKAEFLATVSHELRTPLNAVTGYASLLREGIPVPLPEESLDYVDRIGHSARHLLHLIEDILTFSRLETGQEVIRARPIQVQELLAEVRAIIEPMAQEKGLRLTIEAPDEPVQLHTDPRRLRQILHNLLDNAIKFTAAGEVALSVHREGDRVWFRVRDTGIGIAPQDWKKIFEPFKQLEQSNTRVAGGTGLGLSVTDKLVRLLGGRLELESEAGEGSTFCVCLPAGGPRHASGNGAAARERSTSRTPGSDE
ncbi:hypothetical protein BH24GEM3_BH24GEM3_03870 [soil metagenome]